MDVSARKWSNGELNNRSCLSIKSGPFPLHAANSQNCEFWEENQDHLASIPSSQNDPAIYMLSLCRMSQVPCPPEYYVPCHPSGGHCALSHYLLLALSALSELLSGKSSKGSRIATHMPRYKVCPVQNLISWLIFVSWTLFNWTFLRRKEKKGMHSPNF